MFLAYLDPGAGSMLIQRALAAALTVPFLFKSKVSAALRRLRGQRSDSQPTGSTVDETRRPS
jgi:hypothetical protein